MPANENVEFTPAKEKPLRADAERNRRRLLDAAATLFCERGLDVGVGEIAQLAGVGRGTLFRNFPSKEDLIAAIVIERMNDASALGRSLLDAPEPTAALFRFLEEIVGRRQLDRALFEAVGDTFLANPEIRSAYAALVGALDLLIARAQQAGAVRDDVGSLDVLMMIKGVCQAASSFAHLDPEVGERQLDLVRAALCNRTEAQPLRGRAPTFSDIERTFAAAAAGAQAAGEPAAGEAHPRGRRAALPHGGVDRDGDEQQREVQQ
jgi:AcrR family transcriptional regulator